MKTFLLLASACWLLLTAGDLRAFDWAAAARDAGAVEVVSMTLQTLAPSDNGWTGVPATLLELHAQIFKAAEKDHSGVIEYKVTKGGWVLVAGHFGNEGRRGDWSKERWEEKDLEREGWVKVSPEEAGGGLVNGIKQPFDLFAKRVEAGTEGRMRFNKYSFPYFILLGGGGPVNPAIAKAPAASTRPSTPSPRPVSATPLPVAKSLTSAELVKTQHNNLVVISGTNGAGSGFVAELGGATYLFTNAHVAEGVKGASVTTMDGTKVPVGAAAVAIDHDVFRMAVTPAGKPFEVMMGVDADAAIGDEVVVLGNSEGAGVINPIAGKIVGIGPNLVEVDAAFVPGNSGSPIVHLKSGKVIGVATYAIIRKYDITTKEPMKNSVIRRFGYRLDSIKTWQPFNWEAFSAQAAQLASIEKLTQDLDSLVSDLAAHHRISADLHTNPAIKIPIELWLADRSRQLSPSDRAMAQQNFVSRLKSVCQADLTAARPRLTYDYFQHKLSDEQRYRDNIAGVFSKLFQPGASF